MMRKLAYIQLFIVLNFSVLRSNSMFYTGEKISGKNSSEKVTKVMPGNKSNSKAIESKSTLNSEIITKKEHDTIRQPILIEEETRFTFADSMELFPAYGVYNEWDTVNVHSGDKREWKNFNDSVVIYFDNSESCGYYHPVQGLGPAVNSGFGYRDQGFHYGIDIELNTGDSVMAAFEGKIRIARRSYTYGNLVVIRHTNGLETYYAHLSKIKVEVGQSVKAGELLGLGGNTGRSRGSHLHFEVRYKGLPIDPNEFISFKENRLNCDNYSLTKRCFQYLEKVEKHSVKGKGSYVIRKGDTLSAIALRKGTTVKRICQLNGLKKTSILKVGKKIRV